MTNHHDNKTGQPNPSKRSYGDFIRRADGSWNVLPLILGALAIVAVSYMLLGDRFTDQERIIGPAMDKTAK